MAKVNPFRPGKPVSPGMFAGRLVELDAIDNALVQAKYDNSQHFLVTGERAIGKSSLLFVAEAVATGAVSTLGGERLHFLTVPLTVKRNETQTTVARRIMDKVKRQTDSMLAKAKLMKIADFVTRLEVAGTRLHPAEQIAAATDVADNLVEALCTTVTAIAPEHDGVCILIDEADSAGAEVGALLKTVVDGLARAGCGKVVVGVAGLPDILDKIRSGHESGTRLFQVLPLEPLEDDERKDVVRKGLAEARDKTGVETTIADDALDLIAHLSDGYPHFIQQYAHDAFDADSDQHITVDDVLEGAFRENGAIAQLGQAIFNTQVFRDIRTPSYRSVLGAMAPSGDSYVTKAKIREITGLQGATLTNALSAMSKKHIILRHPEKRGEYRLPTQTFALWLRAVLPKLAKANGMGDK